MLLVCPGPFPSSQHEAPWALDEVLHQMEPNHAAPGPYFGTPSQLCPCSTPLFQPHTREGSAELILLSYSGLGIRGAKKPGDVLPMWTGILPRIWFIHLSVYPLVNTPKKGSRKLVVCVIIDKSERAYVILRSKTVRDWTASVSACEWKGSFVRVMWEFTWFWFLQEWVFKTEFVSPPTFSIFHCLTVKNYSLRPDSWKESVTSLRGRFWREQESRFPPRLTPCPSTATTHNNGRRHLPSDWVAGNFVSRALVWWRDLIAGRTMRLQISSLQAPILRRPILVLGTWSLFRTVSSILVRMVQKKTSLTHLWRLPLVAFWLVFKRVVKQSQALEGWDRTMLLSWNCSQDLQNIEGGVTCIYCRSLQCSIQLIILIPQGWKQSI